MEKPGQRGSLTSDSSEPRRGGMQGQTHEGQKWKKKKTKVLVERQQPSLTWLLPGASKAQRRPLPRPTKPPPPGITPLRRLGVWRRVREEGEAGTAVFVTLEGEVVRKPHSYYAAQRDEAVLAAAGIRGRGQRSCISVPEELPPFALSRASSDLQLQYWCLPSTLVRAYAALGVESLYQWQADCLHLALPSRKGRHTNNQDGTDAPWRSLIYCAPTSGGKSLVAEVLIARRLLFEGVRSLVVVPHVSLCAERVQQLRQLLGPLVLRVEAFHAGANAASNWYAGVDVAVCTLEKANLIINKWACSFFANAISSTNEASTSTRVCFPGVTLPDRRLVQDLLVSEVTTTDGLEDPSASEHREGGKAAYKECVGDSTSPSVYRSACWAREWWDSVRARLPYVRGKFPVGLICVDEIHFIGDPQRGHLLEMLLAKLVFINKILQHPVQLIGMSATLPNARQIANWLGAEVFVTDKRPSPLDIFVKVGSEVFTTGEGEELRLVRRLHDGRLSLPPSAEGATCAAAQAVAAAASAAVAVATDPGSGASTQQAAPGVGALGGHASLAAAALRSLREQEQANAVSCPSSDGQGETARRDGQVGVAEGSRSGWQADAEHLGALTWEVLREGRRVIVFCPTQEWAARTAGFLAKALPFYRRAEAWADLVRQRASPCMENQIQMPTAALQAQRHPQQPPPHQASSRQQDQMKQQHQQALRQAQKELLELPAGLLAQLLVQSPHLYVDPQAVQGREEMKWQLTHLSLLPPTTMLDAVREGVAFHHAGLSGAERECVEAGYRRGHLDVLCATSTLALGVNLPAARVIIRAPHVGRDEFLSPGRFHQMAGRAGRKGLESRGDAYLICTPSTLPKVRTLIASVAVADASGEAASNAEGVVLSCLKGQSLCRFFLETVHVLLPLLRSQVECHTRVASTAFVDVMAILLRCTLRGHQDSYVTLIEEAAECARYLHSYYLLEAEPGASVPPSSANKPADGNGGSDYSALGQEGHGVPGAHGSSSMTEGASRLGERACDGAGRVRKPSLRSLAFPSSPLPGACRVLLQQYPCLRSPAVLTRMLQGGEFDDRSADGLPTSAPSRSHQTLRANSGTPTVVTAASPATPRSPLKASESLGPRAQIAAAAAEDREAFAASFRLHFRGLDMLAGQLVGHSTSSTSSTLVAQGRGETGNWADVGGRLAATEAGAAAVEAGLAPWEAAELFADVFKTSVLGLCGTTELHLIFLAAVSVGGDAQPHWKSYLSVYDSLDVASKKVADSLGIRRRVICSESIKAQQGTTRRTTKDTPDLLLADTLTFDQLRSRVEIETHRRFFFALLLHDVYREGEAYDAVMRKFGITKSALVACTSQGALVSATVATFLRSLRPQEAALSDVCFMLAGKLKLACSPMGTITPTLVTPANPLSGPKIDDPEAAAALQQFLQLEGMTPRRAVALRAVKINSCVDLVNAPAYDIFKALEAAEPAPLAPADGTPQSKAAWMYKMRRQHARLLAVAVKLKDAAQQEQAMKLQALEDEAAAHWSLVGKVTEGSEEQAEPSGGCSLDFNFHANDPVGLERKVISQAAGIQL